MPSRRFIDVVVEPHNDLPDGCRVQFQAAPGEKPRPVSLIRYQPFGGAGGLFRVEARGHDAKPGSAQAVLVENRGAAPTTLIWGGGGGLRLFRANPPGVQRPDNGEESPIAAPYLLVAAEQIVS